jgi:GNAT superfamily N-acetyltransferase
MIRIRPARPEDVSEIHAMIGELAAYERAPDAVVARPEDLHAALFTAAASGGAGPALFGHVAEVVDDPVGEGGIAGFALWFLNYSTWLGRHGLYLEDLYVREAWRGRGCGEALLATLARVCVERGLGRFEWWVLDWNTPAIDFYRARGAVAMDDWTVHRLTGEALHALARRAPEGEGQNTPPTVTI